MTQYGFPFNSEMVDGVPDRPGNAKSLAAYLAAFFTDGILPHPADALKVRITSGMNVNVSAGACVIDGHLFRRNASVDLEVDAAHSSMNRIDRVVVRLDHNRRLMELGVLTGDPATNPAAPTLTRNANVYEMCLAEIMVTQGESSLSAANITDTRSDSTLCGVSGMTAHQEIKSVDLSNHLWKLKMIDGEIATEMPFNNSKFIQGLNLVIIDLRFKLNAVPYEKDTLHELAYVPDVIKPKFLKALTAVNNSVNDKRNYQAFLDASGLIGLRVSEPITTKAHVSIQGVYVLD